MLIAARYIRNLASIVFVGFLLVFETALGQTTFSHRTDPTSKTELALCKGRQFALCAASFCTPTGKTISVNQPNGGTVQFPEVTCNCPVLPEGDKGAIANLNGGNMAGSCDNTGNPYPGGVWSLFQPNSTLPQEIYGWNSQDAPANNICLQAVNSARRYSNCFSFACEAPQQLTAADGSIVKVSKCHCPVGEDVFSALPERPGSGFLTQFGGSLSTLPSTVPPYQNLTQADACNGLPVGGF